MSETVGLSDLICTVQGLSDRVDCLLWVCGALCVLHVYWLVRGLI